MRKLNTALSGKGLLAASIATLAAGPALAEVAGRANFVTGNVSVTGKDGSTRELRRGDSINTGDRISTNSGRLQIRFSDGGFVSLQPGTVFGIDEYLYANRKPEETSLFFSLLQGGMRTVTGAIGKVNKQSYKVRTPVATIGIRGTGYRAQIMRNGGLLVSVGSGFVNVANRMGDTTAGSGQNIVVPDETTSPGLTNEQADIAATGTNGDQEDTPGNNQDDSNPSGGNLLAQQFGNTDDPSQLPGFTPDTPPEPQPVILASPRLGSVTQTEAQFIGSNLLTAQDNGVERFNAGTLKTVDKGSWGNLRWGVFTDGQSASNSLFNYEGGITLGSAEFLPYIFSAVPASNLYSEGSATYSLQGKSRAYGSNGGIGTLNSLNLTVHFADWTMDADMQVSVGQHTYSASGNRVAASQSAATDSFNLYLSAEGAGCSTQSFGCSTSITGFFTGNQSQNGNGQIGASYTIYGTADGTIDGVAALTRTGYTAPPQLIPAMITSSGISAGATRILGGFSDGALVQAQDALANPSFDIFAIGTLQSVNKGSSGNLHWGAFTNGSSATNSLFDNYSTTVTLGSDEFLPYLYGSPVTSSYQEGTATYSLQGAGSAYTYASNGNSQGTLDHFDLTFRFGSWTLDADMQVTTAGGTTYNAGGTGLSAGLNPGGSVFSSQLETTGGSCTGPSAGCYTLVSGFFSGALNNQIGLSYGMFGLDGGTTSIKGVAALGQDEYFAPGNSLPDSTDFDYAVLTCSGGFCYSPERISASFDQDGSVTGNNGSLIQALVDFEGIQPYFDIGSLQTSGVTTDGGLSWGEYTNGSTSVGNMLGTAGPATVGSTEFVPYIVGQLQPHTFLTGSATYSLQGGTSPRSSTGGSGTLDYFNISFDFDFNSLTAGFQVTMDSNVYSVETDGNRGMPLSGYDDGRFTLYSDNLLVNGAACGSGSSTCALIGGFFAGQGGQQIGVSYEISGTAADGDITGVAALGLSSSSNGPSPTPVDRNGYVLVRSDSQNGAPHPFGGSITSFPDDSLSNTYDANGGLLTSGGAFDETLDRGTALIDDIGRNNNLDWGRWYGNGAQISGVNESILTLNTNQSLHYITGPLAPYDALDSIAQVFGSGAEATYTLAGGTTATATDGRTGTLSGQLTVTFGSGTTTLDADLGLAMSSGNNYSLTATGISVSNSLPTFSGELGCASSGGSTGCSANMSGFFSGGQAQQVGLGYTVNDFDNGSVINGAAAFNQGTITPGAGGGQGI